MFWYRCMADFRRCFCVCCTHKLWSPWMSLVQAMMKKYGNGRLMWRGHWRAR